MGSISAKKHGMAILENIEYEINIFQKHEMEILQFLSSIKGAQTIESYLYFQLEGTPPQLRFPPLP